jgi:hypothetical protein
VAIIDIPWILTGFGTGNAVRCHCVVETYFFRCYHCSLTLVWCVLTGNLKFAQDRRQVQESFPLGDQRAGKDHLVIEVTYIQEGTGKKKKKKKEAPGGKYKK